MGLIKTKLRSKIFLFSCVIQIDVVAELEGETISSLFNPSLVSNTNPVVKKAIPKQSLSRQRN